MRRSVHHDIAQAMSLQIEDVTARKRFLRGAGVLPHPIDTELAGWDWLA